MQKILNDIKHFEEKAPSGTLRIHNKNGKTYYYRQMKDEEGKMIQQYLPLREMNFIRILAQKSYCKKLKTKAERNLKILQQVEADYDIGWMREIYEEQEYQRKKLITPYLKPEEVVLKEWEEEKPNRAAAVIATLTTVTFPVPKFLISLSLKRLEIMVPPAIIMLIMPA